MIIKKQLLNVYMINYLRTNNKINKISTIITVSFILCIRHF